LLLLIACANVAGLMLSRIAAHRHDDTVRAALGASRAALVRRWAAEAAVLFAAGTALAVLFGRWMLDALLAIAPVDVAGLAGISLDWRVVGVTLVATAAAAALCGLIALLRASAGSLSQALHRARSTSTRQALRARSALVVLQIAFSLALVVAAVLVVRSFINMRSLDTGFTADGVLTFGIEPRGVEFNRLNRWVEEFTGQLLQIDGVESAGAIYLRPLALGPIGQESSVVLEQQPDDVATRRQNPTLNYQVATPGYFNAMRIQLIRGRLFGALDDERHPRVAIVGQSTARRLWPGQDPIGRRMLLPSFIPGDRTPVWRTVIGVVSDVSYRGLADVRLDVYDAAAQAATPATDIVVRAAGDPLRLISAVQATARRLDASVVIDRVTTMDAIVSRETAPWRFSGWVLSVFGGMAFLLAGLGLFALIAVEVGDRRRELAIRMALGAQRRDVVRMILRAAAVRLALGLTLGLAAAAVLARALGALLFGVSPGDVVSYAAAAAIVAIVVGTAAYLPSRRAAATNPTLLLD
jgi:putative ABC transport system permease protein